MRVSVDGSGEAVVEFESDAELDAELEGNIAAGGLAIPTAERIPELAPLRLTLRLDGGGETTVPAVVVRHLPGAIAVAIEASAAAIAAALRARPAADREQQSAWDRVRALTRNEKLLLAPKADRAERLLLAQDSDGQVLYTLLRNPRITAEEVTRIARSTQLPAVAAELILKTAQWSANLEVRVALVNNPRVPTPLALKILPTLPEREIRQIAKATAVSQALKQAALRIVVNRP